MCVSHHGVGVLGRARGHAQQPALLRVVGRALLRGGHRVQLPLQHLLLHQDFLEAKEFVKQQNKQKVTRASRRNEVAKKVETFYRSAAPALEKPAGATRRTARARTPVLL